MVKSLLKILACSSLILMTACLPHFKNKMSKPIVDDRIVGTWQTQFNPGKEDTLIISKLGKSNYKIFGYEIKEGQKKDLKPLKFTITRAGNNFFWNVSDTEDSKKDDGFILVSYKFDEKGQLLACILKNDFVIPLIEEKKLAGTIRKEKWISTPIVTASSDDLTKVFSQMSDEQLFQDEVVILQKTNN